ncbi:hypothetical protein LMG33810_002365 [Carnimonas sp. LMG 33810]
MKKFATVLAVAIVTTLSGCAAPEQFRPVHDVPPDISARCHEIANTGPRDSRVVPFYSGMTDDHAIYHSESERRMRAYARCVRDTER